MIGQTISHYKIIEKLGEGGMGVVYKAEDLKLERLVALKFLPPHINATDQDKARFLQEAKAAAALNHPNVCSVIDIQDYDASAAADKTASTDSGPGRQLFIVMEYIDGRTLREKKDAVSMAQAIEIGIQIAEGLAAAHEKGIVHRDIKPDNIMVRKDGIVQIMDFGLAKLQGVSRLTREGSTVGTAGYMSPEQVQGLEVDHRSDIFSYGVLMYELITGQLPFKGLHETALTYEIVNVDPAPMSAVKPEIGPDLDRIIMECLEKDANERTQSIRQVAVDLRRFKRESGRKRMSRVGPVVPGVSARADSGERAKEVDIAPKQSTRPSRGMTMFLMIALGISLIALVTLAFIHFREPAQVNSSILATILPPDNWKFASEDGGHIALSPDGTLLAFVARDSSGKDLLWVRPLNSLLSRPFAETENAAYPFWSPDNKYIGFFASGKMKKIALSGGQPVAICDAPAGRGGTWNKDGIIVFAPQFNNTGLYRVSAEGGDAVPVTRVDTTIDVNHRWPFFLPDGNHFIFTSQSVTRTREYFGAIYVSALDPPDSRLLVKVSSNVAYIDGYLLYVQQSTLVARSLDLKNLQLTGEAAPVAEKIEFSMDKNRGVFTASLDKSLVYQTAGGTDRTLVWYDRSGKKLNTIVDKITTDWGRLSPDGKYMAYESPDVQSGSADVWLRDLDRGSDTRFTFNKDTDNRPVWSPDGTRIVFASDRTGNPNLYIKNSSGSQDEQLLFPSKEAVLPCDWSPDGRYIIFQTYIQKTGGWDLFVLPVDGDKKITPFLQTDADEVAARFSPNMKWVAYQSEESGKDEIYVRPFPSGTGKWQVSSNGGQAPFWSSDGKELYYSKPDGAICVAEANITGASFAVGTAKVLFTPAVSENSICCDGTKDGRRFILSSLTGSIVSPPLTLVTEWDKDLKKK